MRKIFFVDLQEDKHCIKLTALASFTGITKHVFIGLIYHPSPPEMALGKLQLKTKKKPKNDRTSYF